MNLLQSSLCVLLATLALFSSTQASLYIPSPLDDLRALSQAADIVIVARITNFEQGRSYSTSPQGFYIKGQPEKFSCKVQQTVVGNANLKGKQVFTFEGGDNYKWEITDDQYLIFLRQSTDGYELCGSPIKIKDGHLQVWFDNKPLGGYSSLKDLMPLIKKNFEMKVEFTGAVPYEIPASSKVLRTAWTFKNTGRHSVRILRPSSCFNSLISRRLRNGGWNTKTDPWQSVGHWDFLSKSETPVRLLPGKEITLHYDIPLEILQMTEIGDYEISFYYHQNQLSRHHRSGKTSTAELQELWRGEPPQSTFIVYLR